MSQKDRGHLGTKNSGTLQANFGDCSHTLSARYSGLLGSPGYLLECPLWYKPSLPTLTIPQLTAPAPSGTPGPEQQLPAVSHTSHPHLPSPGWPQKACSELQRQVPEVKP